MLPEDTELSWNVFSRQAGLSWHHMMMVLEDHPQQRD